MRTRLRVGVAFLVSAFAVACSDFGPGDEVGIWELRTLNGASVPGRVTIYNSTTDSISGWIEYDRMELKSGGDCLRRSKVSLNGVDFAESTESDCHYEIDFEGGTIEIVRHGYLIDSGTVDGRSFRLTDKAGNVGVYRKT